MKEKHRRYQQKYRDNLSKEKKAERREKQKACIQKRYANLSEKKKEELREQRKLYQRKYHAKCNAMYIISKYNPNVYRAYNCKFSLQSDFR